MSEAFKKIRFHCNPQFERLSQTEYLIALALSIFQVYSRNIIPQHEHPLHPQNTTLRREIKPLEIIAKCAISHVYIEQFPSVIAWQKGKKLSSLDKSPATILANKFPSRADNESREARRFDSIVSWVKMITHSSLGDEKVRRNADKLRVGMLSSRNWSVKAGKGGSIRFSRLGKGSESRSNRKCLSMRPIYFVSSLQSMRAKRCNTCCALSALHLAETTT